MITNSTMMLHYEAIPQHHKLNFRPNQSYNTKISRNKRTKMLKIVSILISKVLPHHDNSAVIICRITLNWLPMTISMSSDADNALFVAVNL